jgi:hypothetical protein
MRRVPVILLGYAAAVLATSIVVVATFWLGLVLVTGPSSTWLPFGTLIEWTAISVVLISIIPAAIGVLIAERKGLRAARFYIAFGALTGIAGLIIQMVMSTSEPGEIGLAIAAYGVVSMLAAGALGGLAYWSIAGRRAGGSAAT